MDHIVNITHCPDVAEALVPVVFVLEGEAVVCAVVKHRIRDDDGLVVPPDVVAYGGVGYVCAVAEDLDFCGVVHVEDVIGDADVACGGRDDIAGVDLVGDVALGGGVAVDGSVRESVRSVEGVTAGAPCGAGGGATVRARA